ncbi:MAG: hypothetical protein GWM87_06535 [Xanthomonadales bacterium]|nr:hypothetical protein [Xanthomonadales bacterium]NIX12626.1 hypothetical protein [Xanthomonadales bacterium]
MGSVQKRIYQVDLIGVHAPNITPPPSGKSVQDARRGPLHLGDEASCPTPDILGHNVGQVRGFHLVGFLLRLHEENSEFLKPASVEHSKVRRVARHPSDDINKSGSMLLGSA